MDIKEAKDFLVLQTAEQARIEGTPFSDLERRMMYYAEGASATEADQELNEEFDASLKVEEYEKKMGGLLRGAYTRVRKEDPVAAQRWQECIHLLAKGDHYISILWDLGEPHDRPRYDFLKLLLAGILLAVVLMSATFLLDHFGFKVPQLRRIILYPVLLPVAWILVKRLGRRNNAKPQQPV